MMKCSKCQKMKDPDDFSAANNSRGKAYWCKTCSTAYYLLTEKKSPGFHKEYMRKYRAQKLGRDLCGECGRLKPAVVVSRREKLKIKKK